MNPTITKMEHLAIIANGFKPSTIVVKSPIQAVVGFLDPALHCNKLTLQCSKCSRLVQTYKNSYACMPVGNYLNKLEKHAVESNFIKFAVLQPQFTQLRSQTSYTQFTIRSKPWSYFSGTIFQPLPKGTSKYHCVALSFSILHTHLFRMTIL